MKNLKNIGKSLNIKEQKKINGGITSGCTTNAEQLSCEADSGNWISTAHRPGNRFCDGYCQCDYWIDIL
ncbi:MAG: hypothetical protein EVB11_01560 [Winogradskyella sp.]|nr:MAG: hypothetical protein EVB11_01560 [Winogradskyella sp.]